MYIHKENWLLTMSLLCNVMYASNSLLKYYFNKTEKK